MNEPGHVTTEQRRAAGPVFVSYATSDRKQALALCKALERRGTKCWISCRDVEPGENYQEAIVRAIRGAPAMVFAVDRFILYESRLSRHGPHYEEVADYPLLERRLPNRRKRL